MLIGDLAGLWREEVERIVRTQQSQQQKLVKLLLSPGTPSAPPALQDTVAANEPVSSGAKPARRVNAPPPGKWLKSSLVPAPLPDGSRAVARMNYWLYLPNRPRTADLPLVVMLHGCAQSATQFARSTRMNQLAEEEGFAVLYPQQSASRNGGRCWRWYKKSVQLGGGDARAVVAVINAVTERHQLDKRRIYIAGISAGATLANIIAVNYPHLIAAVGLHSGSVFGTAQTPVEGYRAMQRGGGAKLYSAVHEAAGRIGDFPVMPAIMVHGRDDTIVRPVNLAHQAEQFRELHHLAGIDRKQVLAKITKHAEQAGVSNAYTSYEYYAGKQLLLKACEVVGLGHAWSGGDGSQRFSTDRGPDASRLMWEFFCLQQRSAQALPDKSLRRQA